MLFVVLEFQALILAQDDHKPDAVFFGIERAQGFAAPAVFVLIGPCLPTAAPQALHVIFLVNQGA